MSQSSVRSLLVRYSPDKVARQAVVRTRLRTERTALALRHRPVRTRQARHGRILAYHSIGTREWGINDVSPRAFERHLQAAADDGWTFATPAQVLAEPDKPQLALTFDDGLASVLHNAVPVLRHHGVPATMFVVTNWADRQWSEGDWAANWPGLLLDWGQLRELQAAGVTIASHSVTHRDFGQFKPGTASRELEVSRERLRAMLGVETAEFAIPYGQSRNWSAEARTAAAQAGYTHVYAQAVNTRPEGTIPRTFIGRIDSPWYFRAALAGAYDDWEETF